MDQMPPVMPEEQPAPARPSVPEARRQIALTVLSLLFILIVSQLIGVALVLILRVVAPDFLTVGWVPIALSSLPSYLVAMPLSLLLFRRIPATPPEKKPLALPSFLGFFALTVFLTWAGSAVGLFINSLIGGLIGEIPTNALDEVAAITPLWAQVLFFVILAPIFEEIFFRKLLFDRLSKFGELPAILVCGILFGLIHGNFYQFFYAAGVGILFSFLYSRTGKIIYTMILHMILNFSGTILAGMLEDLFFTESDTLSGVGVLVFLALGFVVLLSLAVAVFYWIRTKKHLSFEKRETDLSTGDFCRALFCNPATIVFLIFTLLLFLEII